MEVKVLGPGCAKCKTTFQVIEKVIKDWQRELPDAVVDGEVKMKGQVPSESDVKRLLGI